MITAVGPDGTRHVFLDDTDLAVIDGVMKRTYGTPAPGGPAAAQPQDAASDYYSQPIPYSTRFSGLADIGREAAQGATLGTYQAPPDVGQRTGWAGTFAQGLGAMVPFALTEGGLGLAGMAPGLARTALAGSIAGGGETAGTEFGTGQKLSAPDIAMGAGVGGAAGALAHGLASVGRLASTAPEVPTAAANAKRSFERMRKMRADPDVQACRIAARWPKQEPKEPEL